MANSKDALQALLTKIAGIVTGVRQDGDTPKIERAEPNASYLAWCSPGLPVQAKDLKFLTKGTGEPELLRQAADFAQLANIIPEQNVMARFRGSGSMLWDVYSGILDESQVRHKQLTESEEKTLDKYRAVLGKEVPDEDDKTKTVHVVSGKVKAYEKYKKAYEDAAMEYNRLSVAAASYDPANKDATKDDKIAFQEFQRNGGIYKKRVQAKMEEWAAEGYKNEVEGARNYIKQFQEKDASIIKASIQSRMEKSVDKLTDPMRNIPFYYTGVIPTSFASDDAEGWTEIMFNNSETKTFNSISNINSKPKLNFGWGFWKVNVGTDITKNDVVDNNDTNDLKISFSMTQTPIMRSWFAPEFIQSQGWRMKPGAVLGETIADGNGGGKLPAYPTTAIWVKDVKITSKAFADHVRNNYLKTDTDTSVGWGPFSIGGKTTTEKTEKSKSVTIDENTVTIKGYQVIAFLCYKMPVTPNPAYKGEDGWL